MITLLQSADESTFVHESGHYFLDVMTDVAGKDGTPSQVRADVQTIMDWFGIKDLDEWNSLSLELKRQYHEQFARGFEQYLREGEAPSEGLRQPKLRLSRQSVWKKGSCCHISRFQPMNNSWIQCRSMNLEVMDVRRV